MNRPTDTAPDPRSAFAHVERHTTRWNDNDVYGHVNNVVHYMLFDAAVNAWLIREGGLDIHHGSAIGLCVESSCRYHAALEYPASVDVALRVGHLGRTSVAYELAVLSADADDAAADGRFVHVFVDRVTRRPVAIPQHLRIALQRLVVPSTDTANP